MPSPIKAHEVVGENRAATGVEAEKHVDVATRAV